MCDIYELTNVVSHKYVHTKSPVHKSLHDKETAILIKLQSTGNILFSNFTKTTETRCKNPVTIVHNDIWTPFCFCQLGQLAKHSAANHVNH